MDDVKNPPSPSLRHHRPGLANGGVPKNSVALASEWDILQLEARLGSAVCLYIRVCLLADSHCLKVYTFSGIDSIAVLESVSAT